MPTVNQIIAAIEEVAPRSLQEEWDNSGWQCLAPGQGDSEATGVMLCLDPLPGVIDEAVAAGCNLVVSHHPLIFKGIRSLTGQTVAQDALLRAVRGGVAVYSAHTSLDNAPCGPSARLASLLGLTGTSVLSPRAADPSTGLGIIGTLPTPLSADAMAALVRRAYEADAVRVTNGTGNPISRVALCSGSGGEFITAAIAAGADAYITSDVRYHDFLDHGRKILIIDTCHYDSEKCTKSIFSDIISKKFPNFAVRSAECEKSPVRTV